MAVLGSSLAFQILAEEIDFDFQGSEAESFQISEVPSVQVRKNLASERFEDAAILAWSE